MKKPIWILLFVALVLSSLIAAFDCYNCGGTGVVQCTSCDGIGRTGSCFTCNGMGIKETSCLSCNGSGETIGGYRCSLCNGQGIKRERCYACNGTGYGNKCFSCNGLGYKRCSCRRQYLTLFFEIVMLVK